MDKKDTFSSAGERLVASLWSYRKGNKSVDYEIRQDQIQGFVCPPVIDEIAIELLALLFDEGRTQDLFELAAWLKDRRLTQTPPRNPVA